METAELRGPPQDKQKVDPQVAGRIRLLGLDVDGVLTDAGVYIGMVGDNPAELKRFDIQDGVGIRLLQDAGVKVVIVSGRISRATTLRAKELDITDVVQDDRARKLPGFEKTLARHGVPWEAAAFMGDDLPDLPVLKRVGLPVAVRNAVADVREVAQFVTEAPGGRGAVREFAEVLLKARDEWQVTVQRYLRERGESVLASHAS